MPDTAPAAPTRRSPGAPPAMLRSENLPRSNRKRWYLHVYHPDLTAAERTELDAHGQGAPLYVLGILVGAIMAFLTGLAAGSAPGRDAGTVVFAALSVAFLTLMLLSVRTWVVRRRPSVVIKAGFKAAHPGEPMVRYTSMEETERAAIAAVEAAIAKLSVSHRDREAALHQRLWLAAKGTISALDVHELTELTAGHTL